MKLNRNSLFWVFVIAGVLVSMIDRAYYILIFLPNYHGSFKAASKQFIDLSGFMTCIKTVPGGLLFGLTALIFLIAAALAITSGRSRRI